jgi:hypothetical protein
MTSESVVAGLRTDDRGVDLPMVQGIAGDHYTDSRMVDDRLHLRHRPFRQESDNRNHGFIYSPGSYDGPLIKSRLFLNPVFSSSVAPLTLAGLASELKGISRFRRVAGPPTEFDQGDSPGSDADSSATLSAPPES